LAFFLGVLAEVRFSDVATNRNKPIKGGKAPFLEKPFPPSLLGGKVQEEAGSG
jgi:hypothetical protein